MLWDEQQVYWSSRIDIVEGQKFFVLVHDFSGDFVPGDFTEQTIVTHGDNDYVGPDIGPFSPVCCHILLEAVLRA